MSACTIRSLPSWRQAWEFPSPEKRISYLRALTVGENSIPVAIAALYFSIGKVAIPDEVGVREKYGALQKRLGNTLFTHLEKAGRIFCAGEQFWNDSLKSSFWQGARKADRVFFRDTLGLAGGKLPSKLFLGPKQPVDLEETLSMLVDQTEGADRTLFACGIKALYGDRSSLLMWNCCLLTSIWQKEAFRTDQLSEREQKQLEEGEELLFSFIDRRISPDDQATVKDMVHAVADIQIRKIGRITTDQDSCTEAANLEKLRRYLFLQDLPGPFRYQLLPKLHIILLSRILHLSTDREEQTRCAKRLASLYPTLQAEETQALDPSFHFLCYDLLHIRNRGLEIFVQAISEPQWLLILGRILREFDAMTKTGKADSHVIVNTFWVLKAFFSFHISKKQPIPVEIASCLERVLSVQEFLDLSLFHILGELPEEEFRRFFLPYTLLYTEQTPLIWLFFTQIIRNHPSLLSSEFHSFIQEKCREPIGYCALLSLYEKSKNYPPEAIEWADRLSSHTSSMNPQNLESEAYAWSILNQLFLYRSHTEEISTSVRTILCQIRDLCPTYAPLENIQFDIFVQDLMLSTSSEQALSCLKQIESIVACIDPKNIAYLHGAFLLIMASAQKVCSYAVPEDCLNHWHEQLLTHHQESFAIGLFLAIERIQLLQKTLASQTSLELTASIRDDVQEPIVSEQKSTDSSAHAFSSTSSEEEADKTSDDDHTTSAAITSTTDVISSPEKITGRRASRRQKRLEGAKRPASTELQDLLKRVINGEPFSQRLQTRLFKLLEEAGVQTGSGKMKFSSSSSTLPLAEIMAKPHMIHGPKVRRPLRELAGLARTVLADIDPSSQKDKP